MMTLNEIVSSLGNSDYKKADENGTIWMLKNSLEFKELKRISKEQEKVCEWIVSPFLNNKGNKFVMNPHIVYTNGLEINYCQVCGGLIKVKGVK